MSEITPANNSGNKRILAIIAFVLLTLFVLFYSMFSSLKIFPILFAVYLFFGIYGMKKDKKWMLVVAAVLFVIMAFTTWFPLEDNVCPSQGECNCLGLEGRVDPMFGVSKDYCWGTIRESSNSLPS
jgi:hypothetical protein